MKLINKTFLPLTLGFWLVGCSASEQNTKPNDTSDSISNSGKTDAKVKELEALYLDSKTLVPTEPVDAGKLEIINLAVTTTIVEKNYMGSVSYYANGNADYAEIQVCYAGFENVSSKCTKPERYSAPEKNFRNRYLMKPYEEGKLVVRVRACVNEDRAKVAGVFCGPYSETTYNQPDNVNTEIVTLIIERENKRKILESYSEKFIAALKKFESDSKVCLEKSALYEKVMLQRVAVSASLQMVDLLTVIFSVTPIDYTRTKTVCSNLPNNGMNSNGATGSYMQQSMVIGGYITPTCVDYDPRFINNTNATVAKSATSARDNASNPGATSVAPGAVGTPANPANITNSPMGPVSPSSASPVAEAPMLSQKDYDKNSRLFTRVGQNIKVLDSVNSAAQVFGSAMGINAVKPTGTAQLLGTGIYDLITSDSRVTSECIANEVASRELSTIKIEVDRLKAEIMTMDQKIFGGQAK